ncbi:hypothetical protein [Streptomyces sp. NPDC127039]|uniref:hypothetical protein n=1 Tax=Streptomyces sp. NPDC127039 TaxID=3347115 RepID=UPI00365B0CDC
MSGQAPAVPTGEKLYRVHWALGTDRMRAVCPCGAEQLFDDPVVLWDWLLAHPEGHHPAHSGGRGVPVPEGDIS